MPISNPASFRAAAQYQVLCAVCGAAGAFDAHHVIAKQELAKRGLLDQLYDTRNALRLCTANRCHERYTGRTYHIPTEKLTADNICFMWDVLGVAGHNYLERHYTGADRRFTLHLERRCPLCQLPHRH
jgi:hypothetical protein